MTSTNPSSQNFAKVIEFQRFCRGLLCAMVVIVFKQEKSPPPFPVTGFSFKELARNFNLIKANCFA
jgi:hypothetical protein